MTSKASIPPTIHRSTSSRNVWAANGSCFTATCTPRSNSQGGPCPGSSGEAPSHGIDPNFVAPLLVCRRLRRASRQRYANERQYPTVGRKCREEIVFDARRGRSPQARSAEVERKFLRSKIAIYDLIVLGKPSALAGRVYCG